jgi:segregation and condensation protein A
VERRRPPLDRMAAFLVIGARLVQLKAAQLMPQTRTEETEELEAWEDAIRGRLQEYKRFKELAESLMQRHASGQFTFAGVLEPEVIPQAMIQVNLDALAAAFKQVLDRLPAQDQITFEMEHVSLGEKIEELRSMLRQHREMNFTAIFGQARTRLEAVVTFLALLELIRIGEIKVVQTSVFGEIKLHALEETTSVQ